MSKSVLVYRPKMTLEEFMNENEEELHCLYMETGAYYDQDSEQFIEEMFDVLDKNQPRIH